jgi:GNAT superfamily N-acetyltransferase
VKTTTTAEWVVSTFLENKAIWIVAKDTGGTVRACISSFEIRAPYPNSMNQCNLANPWGIVDWFCVHPLWRGKGLASRLLKLLDYITYRIGRKAHVFLKEGYPLPQIPIYSTVLKCRRAGTPRVSKMREGTGLAIYDYHCKERDTDLPMIRVEGLQTNEDLGAWEDALDTELPPCWVFVNGSSVVDSRKDWRPDSLVSMYAFRWIPGKWFLKKPHSDII